MSEKLCLQWNDFQKNVKTAFRNLREDKYLTDVTLVCEDGRPLEAHKVILAASSPFFQKLLERNKHPYPMIYMRGLKSDDLLAIVDFLYCGEANVFQENLDSFLAIAEELQLKGLMGKMNEKVEDIEEPPAATAAEHAIDTNSKIQKTQFQRQRPGSRIRNAEENRTLAIPGNFLGDFEELEEKVRSMMEKSQNQYANGHQKAHTCRVCGKEGMGSAIKDHIEANHLEGIVIPCNLCDKSFRSRNAFRIHNRQKCV